MTEVGRIGLFPEINCSHDNNNDDDKWLFGRTLN